MNSVAQHMGTIDVGHCFAIGIVPDGLRWVQSTMRGCRLFYYDFTRCLSSYSNSALKFDKDVVSIDEIITSVKDERKIPLQVLPNVLLKINFEHLSPTEAISLLNCCGQATPNASSRTRSHACQLIYQYLLKHDKINLDIFHTYIKICNDNLVPVNYEQLLKTFKLEPTKETYKLLLRNVCEQGNVDQAYGILETMKNKQIPVDEDVFNSLVLCHVLQGGLDGAESILQTMKTAHILESNAIKLSLLKGLLRTRNYKDLKQSLQKYPMILNDQEFFQLLEYVGLTGNMDLYKEVEFLFKEIVLTHDLQGKIKDVCLHLIHMGQPKTALQIYEKLITFNNDVAYIEALLKEMLHCNIDIDYIISVAKRAQQAGRNESLLENLTGFALHHGYVEASFELFKHISVRCHYFWPVFVALGKVKGEKGVFSALEKLKSFNIKPDAETLEFYILPYCNLDNFKALIVKFQEHGMTVKEVLNVLVIFLMKKNFIKEALNLCNSYSVEISHPYAGEILGKAWKATCDTQFIVKLLKKYYESDKNIAQHFLTSSVRLCKSEKDYREFLKLSELVKSENIRLSFTTTSSIIPSLKKCSEEVKDKIKNVINSSIDVSHNMYVEESSIPHPRRMSTQDLECHLIELEEKNLETRGVIRRLIQAHSREGDLGRVGELRSKLQSLGYEESPGMKSSIMHNYVLSSQLEEALSLFKEIKRNHPDFAIDSYKCIDLAMLLVQNSRCKEALSFLQEESQKFGRVNPEPISRNCRALLSAYSENDKQMEMFKFLLETGLCKPSNIMLGPLIRIHLNRNDLDAAVEKYTQFAQKYKCTPLQRELLLAVIRTKNSDLLERALKVTESVHGAGPAHVGLIAALAESGQVKPLQRILVETNLVIKPLLKRQIKRWSEELKVEPLLTLGEAGQRLSTDVINLEYIYSCILDVYGNRNDCDAIVNFYEKLPEIYNIDKAKLEKKVIHLLGKNNVCIPNSYNVTSS